MIDSGPWDFSNIFIFQYFLDLLIFHFSLIIIIL